MLAQPTRCLAAGPCQYSIAQRRLLILARDVEMIWSDQQLLFYNAGKHSSGQKGGPSLQDNWYRQQARCYHHALLLSRLCLFCPALRRFGGEGSVDAQPTVGSVLLPHAGLNSAGALGGLRTLRAWGGPVVRFHLTGVSNVSSSFASGCDAAYSQAGVMLYICFCKCLLAPEHEQDASAFAPYSDA